MIFKSRGNGTLAVINEIPLEEYLASVISSEMSGEAPFEFLKAHAITSRSWLAAMLGREERNVDIDPERSIRTDDELICWYDREDHDIFDVCADDHCQRYQGITKKAIRSGGEQPSKRPGGFSLFTERKFAMPDFQKPAADSRKNLKIRGRISTFRTSNASPIHQIQHSNIVKRDGR